jgi:hypothetical protein
VSIAFLQCLDPRRKSFFRRSKNKIKSQHDKHAVFGRKTALIAMLANITKNVKIGYRSTLQHLCRFFYFLPGLRLRRGNISAYCTSPC